MKLTIGYTCPSLNELSGVSIVIICFKNVACTLGPSPFVPSIESLAVDAHQDVGNNTYCIRVHAECGASYNANFW